MHCKVVIALCLALYASNAAGLLSRSPEHQLMCYACGSDDNTGDCHHRPDQYSQLCPLTSTQCVIERRETVEGATVSIQRRCSRPNEKRFYADGCTKDGAGSGQQICTTYCPNSNCNSRDGRIEVNPRTFNYGSPDYNDGAVDHDETPIYNRATDEQIDGVIIAGETSGSDRIGSNWLGQIIAVITLVAVVLVGM